MFWKKRRRERKGNISSCLSFWASGWDGSEDQSSHWQFHFFLLLQSSSAYFPTTSTPIKSPEDLSLESNNSNGSGVQLRRSRLTRANKKHLLRSVKSSECLRDRNSTTSSAAAAITSAASVVTVVTENTKTSDSREKEKKEEERKEKEAEERRKEKVVEEEDPPIKPVKPAKSTANREISRIRPDSTVSSSSNSEEGGSTTDVIGEVENLQLR